MATDKPLGLRLGPYKALVDQAVDDGRFATRSDAVREAIKCYFLGASGLSEAQVERLAALGKALGVTPDRALKLLLDTHAEGLGEKKTRRPRTNPRATRAS